MVADTNLVFLFYGTCKNNSEYAVERNKGVNPLNAELNPIC